MNKPHLTNTNRAGQSGMFLSTFVTGMFTNFKLSIVNLEKKTRKQSIIKNQKSNKTNSKRSNRPKTLPHERVVGIFGDLNLFNLQILRRTKSKIIIDIMCLIVMQIK